MKQRLLITMLTLLTSITMQAFTPKYGDTWDEATKTLTVNSNPGQDAYSYNKEIMKVVFCNNVTAIGDFAFDSCDNLTSITLSNSITTIGSFAFASSGITSVYICKFVIC